MPVIIKLDIAKPWVSVRSASDFIKSTNQRKCNFVLKV
jgi:hypothetical protein